MFAHRPYRELVAELDDLVAELVLLLVRVGKARGSLAPYPALVFLPDPTDMETCRLDICGASPDCYLENPNLSRSPSASQRLQFSLDQPASASHLTSLGISSHQPRPLGVSPASVLVSPVPSEESVPGPSVESVPGPSVESGPGPLLESPPGPLRRILVSLVEASLEPLDAALRVDAVDRAFSLRKGYCALACSPS